MIKKKFDVKKSYKILKAMEPDKTDGLLLWLFIIVGLYLYYAHPDYEGLLGFLGFGVCYKAGFFIGWTCHALIHAIICKKKKINFKGEDDVSKEVK